MDELRQSAKVFLLFIVGTALIIASITLRSAPIPPPDQLLPALIMGSLVTLALAFPLQFAPKTKFSLHTCAIFAAILLFEPSIALVIAALGTLVAQLLRRQPWDQTFFNSSLALLIAAVGGYVLLATGWDFTTLHFTWLQVLVQLPTVAGLIYVLEVTVVALMVSFQTGENLVLLWPQIAHFDPVEVVAQYTLGFLTAILADASFWSLPLLLPLAYAVHRSAARHIQLQDQTQALAYQVGHDALTRLPNRALYLDRLQHALARTMRHPGTVGVLFVDLDGFKRINDSLGHAAGDHLLLAVADRLRRCVRPSDTVARFGGDEFTVLLEDMVTLQDATLVAARILTMFGDPVLVHSSEVTVGASIGIARATSAQERPEELLRNADIALYQAKAQGKGHYVVWDPCIGSVSNPQRAKGMNSELALER